MCVCFLRNLYCEGILHASVRVELARFVQACFEIDPGELWTTIVVRKKKKRGEYSLPFLPFLPFLPSLSSLSPFPYSPPSATSLPPSFHPETTEDHISPRKALVTMVNDTHHAVRMHMARVVLSLYLGDQTSQALLPRSVQEETFQEVSKMLETAHMVTVSSLCV